MAFFAIGSLHRALPAYVDHYHAERAHPGRAELVPRCTVMPRPAPLGDVQWEERLGGLLRH